MGRLELDVDLTGEVIVVTGGAGVLCGTMAAALAEKGAAVAVLDIDAQAAEKRAAAIRRSGGDAVSVQSDVLSREELERAAETVQGAMGPPTALINGAGGNKAQATTGPETAFFDLPSDAVRWVLDLNFLGAFLCSQVFGKAMVQAGRGNIINISSMSALRPLTKVVAYSAAKAALSNFTQWLAVHMSRNCDNKVRVNAIAPGFFLTQQNRFLLLDEKSGEWTPRGRTILDHSPMGRFGDPDDLIGTVLWLLSDSSRFVHGVVIPVDGGFSAFSGV